MNQRIIIPMDHGNRNLKTAQHVFTSGLIESDCRPVLGEYLYYNHRYYTLSEQRIPYMRDKTSDERFFILTLFGIAMEAERRVPAECNSVLQVELPIGLPPKHYGALHEKFAKYFLNRGIQKFTYNKREYQVEIVSVATFPQDYAAAMTVTFLNAWNNYLWPKVIMISGDSQTMPMLVANLSTGYSIDYGVLMLGVLICSLPTGILFLILQNSFANGIVGAVKG